MSIAVVSKCPQCGTRQIEPDHNFCPGCGCDLRPHKSVLPCCGRVQLIMHDEWDFCPFCGATDPLGKGGAA